MAPQEIRDASQGHAELNKTELIVILTTVGSLILGLLIGLCMLLVRAIRTHRRLLVDLEERGITITIPDSNGVNQPAVAKPRAVLRRTTLLPYNSKSGWRSLPSNENVLPPPMHSVQPHNTEPQARESCRRMGQLPWPFSGRRTSGRALNLKELRSPQLTPIDKTSRGVVNTPPSLKPVSAGPVTKNPSQVRNKRSSDQSLLKHHPVLRNGWFESNQETTSNSQPESPFGSLVCKRGINGKEKHYRPNRSRSVAAIPVNAFFEQSSRISRPKMHSRSVSLCSQSSGYAPDAAVPPLPLCVARLKSEVTRRGLLARSPSRHSVSSFESVGSSILVSPSSPMILRPNGLQLKKATRWDWGNPLIESRPIRDQVALYRQGDNPSESSPKSNTARCSMGTPSTKRHSRRESRNSSLYNPSLRSIGKTRAAETVRLSRVSTSSPAGSNLIVQTMTTPRRQSGTKVSLNGSPQERQKTPVLRDVSRNQTFPTRQLSQTSTQASSARSSNGNPFQWDPTPLQSGKPSALKGSPSARKGHKRQNCVRISLAPTILGPPSGSPSPSVMNDIQEESPDTSAQKRSSTSVGLGFSNKRSLPKPPTSSVFAPDVKLNPTTLRVSVTVNSSILPVEHTEHNADGSPTLGPCDNSNRASLPCNPKRLSNSSVLSIPSFPNPCNDIGSIRSIKSPPSTFAFSRPSDEYVEVKRTKSTITLSPPFRPIDADSTTSSSQRSEATAVDDEYDPTGPQLVHPTLTTTPPSLFSSPFAATPTNSYAFPAQNRTDARLPPHSPPCSPKNLRPRSFLPVSPVRLSSLALDTAAIASSREPLSDTINPAILRTNAFSIGNSLISNSIKSAGFSSSETGLSASLTPAIASTLFEPLIEAAFPSQPYTWSTAPKSSSSHLLPASLPNSRARSHTGSKSAYQPLKSHPSVQSNAEAQITQSSPPNQAPPLRTRSPGAPSPVQTPTSSSAPVKTLSALSDIPTLSPTPMGPRASPPRDLHRTIVALRRMNSDIKGDNKGDRRYLHLGREASLALPGDESWTSVTENAAEDDGGTFAHLGDWEGAVEKALAGGLASERGQGLQGAVNAGADGCKGEDASALSRLPSPLDAEGCSSSVWEGGEKFWASTPSPPPASLTVTPTIAKDTLRTPISNAFEVGKTARGSGGTESVGRDPRRNALAFSINVQPPSTQGTPRSLYDADGFLRG
ncbi:uncharacterized protein K441DRAFT_694454 [Cenococcum geophilum 1.58]|uniref:uncharacterized protein n=1 Tax=Cenococcum geophilum 1.58 TaxID=794803 RepID=UPI00358F2C40|nr:hypothetical protein K441DRAFT_694454 [Cenococcum geophilum 1.58]